MASTLVQRIISSQTETAISMANSTWARGISLPTGWNKVRLGVRYHMTDSGAPLTGGAVFAFGFCSGLSNTFGDPLTTHFLGLVMGDGVVAFDRTAANPSLYAPYAGYSITYGVKRIGITNTYSDTGMVFDGIIQYIPAGADTNSADRGLLFLDITTGSPNYTLFLPFVMNTYPSTDYSATDFLNIMTQPNPVPGPRYGNFGISVAMAVNEVQDGVLNAVNLSWNRVDSQMEICDVAVALLA